MKPLLLALQFLTRLPITVKETAPPKIASSMMWFPAVGLLIGGILVLVRFEAAIIQLPTTITAALLILMLVIITGGLHLDGLSDMCDGFYAGKNREQIISIMRDSKTGAMGVIGIVVVLILKYAILVSLLNEMSTRINDFRLSSVVALVVYPDYFGRQRPLWSLISILLVMPMVSRWGMVLAASISPYAAEEGIGKPFVEHLRPKHWLIATIITYAVAIGLLEIYGFVLCLIGLVIVIISVIYIKQRIGGITGDTLGAINEIVEVGVLFTAYLIYRQ